MAAVQQQQQQLEQTLTYASLSQRAREVYTPAQINTMEKFGFTSETIEENAAKKLGGRVAARSAPPAPPAPPVVAAAPQVAPPVIFAPPPAPAAAPVADTFLLGAPTQSCQPQMNNGNYAFLNFDAGPHNNGAQWAMQVPMLAPMHIPVQMPVQGYMPMQTQMPMLAQGGYQIPQYVNMNNGIYIPAHGQGLGTGQPDPYKPMSPTMVQGYPPVYPSTCFFPTPPQQVAPAAVDGSVSAFHPGGPYDPTISNTLGEHQPQLPLTMDNDIFDNSGVDLNNSGGHQVPALPQAQQGGFELPYNPDITPPSEVNFGDWVVDEPAAGPVLEPVEVSPPPPDFALAAAGPGSVVFSPPRSLTPAAPAAPVQESLDTTDPLGLNILGTDSQVDPAIPPGYMAEENFGFPPRQKEQPLEGDEWGDLPGWPQRGESNFDELYAITLLSHTEG